MCSESGDLLVVEDLARHYRTRPVLRGIDLEVRRGEVVGLLGPNGAGKTTTFRVIAGLDRPTRGRIFLDGVELGRRPLHERARRGLGYLPQEPSVFRDLTALENIVLVLENIKAEAPLERALEMLGRFGLEARAEQRALTLSGGERRRLELARAMSLQPRVLICDEPMTGVDPMAASELRGMLRGLAGDGLGVLLTDHNVAQALPACDRASLLVDGVIVDAGTASELATSEVAKSSYFGDLWSDATELVGGAKGAL